MQIQRSDLGSNCLFAMEEQNLRAEFTFQMISFMIF